MRKTVTIAAMGVLLALPSLGLADNGDQDIRQEIESLRAKLATQQEHIEALEAKLGENLAKTVQEEMKKSEPSQVRLANKFIDNLTLKGDLRVRYERRDVDKPGTLADAARDRFRSRFRAGGVWANGSENWEVGAGLATGGSASTSTNDTWSDDGTFDTGDIRLDYAYAKHRFNDAFKLTLGQHPNPFMTSWLLWDSDARPAGFTAQFDQNGLFVTAGAYDVYQAGDDVAMLFAGQLGYHGKAGEVGYKLAAAYYDFDHKVFDLYTRPNPNYDYRIGSLDGELTTVLGNAKVKAYGQLFENFGADGTVGQGLLGGTLDPEDEDLGWVLGLEATFDKVKFSYAYAQVGADSVIPQLKDADFGDGIGIGVDVEGHKLGASYSFTKDCSLDATAMFYQPMSRTDSAAGVEDVALYQLDINYKF